jgi:hypothetical protein
MAYEDMHANTIFIVITRSEATCGADLSVILVF